MSADNWAICPECRQKELDRLGELHDRAMAAYGVVPAEEFEALRAEAGKPLDEEKFRTFREDYGFHGAQDGVIQVSYGGHCSVCGIGVDFKDEWPFWPKDAATAAWEQRTDQGAEQPMNPKGAIDGR